ncbi:protein associated with the ribbon compartment of flagellar microtubule [Strigomonas culicis]|uniref:EF-hand domain-containing family member C2 n=1 Tax=Strigomonas culicis TaxID=28005 RepID=S9UZ91_9TRYP|nr:protein associated with the ribbon compartment of flagellar microtubule [Strigomonas culicis]|eukprot:EPY19961.1 protein associated with the ribbon compartment of flagellar microtubule [Strigomonas culicis]
MKNSTARTQPEKRFEHLPSDDNRPLAIGANFQDDPLNRNTLRKSHALQLDRKTDYAPHTEYTYTAFDGDKTRSSRKPLEDINDVDVWNGWFSEEISEEDKKYFVARFAGFFKETVQNSTMEKERVRKVCIRFHVEDNSISIQESQEINSGITDTRILDRRQVPKDTRNPSNIFLLSDFQIGGSVTIYGIIYTIVDMDARSRKYAREVLGEEAPAAVPWPDDVYSASVKNTFSKSAVRGVTSDDMDLRRAVEQQLAGIYSKHSNEDITIARQFFKNPIKEHLSYLALWDDRANISGDLHFCVIRLYSENTSIEIVEDRPENCGSTGGPILLSRQRVPKPGSDLAASRFQEHTYGKLMKNNYLSAEDIHIGETYTIYGKPFFVYDCDQFTRDYVKANCGFSLEPAIDIKPFLTEQKNHKVMFYPPPPNGFGSETEKRDNWLTLEGKTARIDLEKVIHETGRVMKFSAKFAKPLSKDDEGRRFLVAFYRETDEVEVTEKAIRNSGFMGGRFLTKGKHRMELPNGTTRPYTPSDFQVGKEVVIFKRPFLLLEMDDMTQHIVNGTDNPTNEDKMRYLLLLLKQQISLKFKKANEAYRSLAPQGTLGYQQVKEFLRSCSCTISDEEAVLLVQNIAPGSNGIISYDQFLEIVNAGIENMDEASLSARSVKNVNMTINTTMKDTASVSEIKHRHRQLRKSLQHKLIQRKGTVQEQFRLLADHSANSRLNRDTFRKSLNEVMHFNVNKPDEDMLVSMLFDGQQDENGDITFKQFQEFIDYCDDLS